VLLQPHQRHVCLRQQSTLTKILRDEIGFKGFVTSDWGAVHAVNFINAGLDMEMPASRPPDRRLISLPSFFDSQSPCRLRAEHPAKETMMGRHVWRPHSRGAARDRTAWGDFGLKLDPKKMPEALKDGTVNEAAITRAAGRVLYEIVRFGYLDGQSKHDVTAQSIEANAKIIEKTGEEAAVLLKNEGGALPLKAADLDSVVLIGPTAGRWIRSASTASARSACPAQVGPLEALKKITGNSPISASPWTTT
jgi:beta-glucosidase